MIHQSDRPHGRLFAKYEVRIEAVPRNDEEIERLSNALDDLDVEESLSAVARRIEESMPDVRVEIA